MTVLFKASKIRSHFDSSGKTRFIARPCKRHIINTNELSKILSHRTTLSHADITACLYAFANVIPELLLDNKSVHLVPFGVFSLSFKSHVEDSEANISQKSIKELRLQFRPDNSMKSILKKVELKNCK